VTDGVSNAYKYMFPGVVNMHAPSNSTSIITRHKSGID